MSNRRVSDRTSRGFTLIELLVALAVFAVMSAMAYSGLTSLLRVGAGVEQTQTALSELQWFWVQMERDVEQAIGRPVLDEVGVSLPGFVGNDGASVFLELTRAGRLNPQQRTRSSMQRISYRLEEDKLIRSSWQQLDRGGEANEQNSVILTDVLDVEIGFLSQSKRWKKQWSGSESNMPRAVEVTVDVAEWGKVRRIFQVPPAS
ncbi:MAG: type II secretion system minor pseudopilin GspJ [Magnetococcales bacterium]|nr:type II secretion system minor pseudopilin GspJ [Magnetococcales bacterium]